MIRALCFPFAMALLGATAAHAFVPVATVRACPRFGPGFIELPGTTTCVRISGRVRAEAGTSTRRSGRETRSGSGVSGQVAVDTRTDTPYGPVRTYVRVRAGDTTNRHTQAYIAGP